RIVVMRRAGGGDAAEQARLPFVRAKLEVAGDVEILSASAAGVQKGGAGLPVVAIEHPRRPGDLDKPGSRLVVKQQAAVIAGDIDIREAIIVDIADGTANPRRGDA